MVWPILGSRTAKEQNRTEVCANMRQIPQDVDRTPRGRVDQNDRGQR